MPATNSVNTTMLQQWIAEKRSPEQIRETLISLGHDDTSIREHLHAFRKKQYAERQWIGFLFLVAGAMTGFIGCVLSLIDPVPELHGVFLYGMTSAAIIMVFAGLYMVFE